MVTWGWGRKRRNVTADLHDSEDGRGLLIPILTAREVVQVRMEYAEGEVEVAGRQARKENKPRLLKLCRRSNKKCRLALRQGWRRLEKSG